MIFFYSDVKVYVDEVTLINIVEHVGKNIESYITRGYRGGRRMERQQAKCKLN